MNDISGEIIIGIWSLIACILFVVGLMISLNHDLNIAKTGFINMLISVIMIIPAVIHYIMIGAS